MEISIQLVFVTFVLLLIAIRILFCKKLISKSVKAIEGIYAGHGTDDMGKSLPVKEVKVTLIDKMQVEVTSPYFPPFRTQIYANCRDIIISNDASRFNVMFNSDLRSLTFEDNKSELTFVGFVQKV